MVEGNSAFHFNMSVESGSPDPDPSCPPLHSPTDEQVTFESSTSGEENQLREKGENLASHCSETCEQSTDVGGQTHGGGGRAVSQPQS